MSKRGVLLLLACVSGLQPPPRVAPPRQTLRAVVREEAPGKWNLGAMWPWPKAKVEEEEPVKTKAPLPQEERFLRDVKWPLMVLSATARRYWKETGDVPPEIVQALLQQYQLLYLFRDVYNDASNCAQAAQRSLVETALRPLAVAQRRGMRGYEALRAAAFEAYAMGALVLEGATRRLIKGQSQARRRRRIRVLGSAQRTRTVRAASESSVWADAIVDEVVKDPAFASSVSGGAELEATKAVKAEVAQAAKAVAPPVAPKEETVEVSRGLLRRLGSQRVLRSAFAVFDTNKDGTINAVEMRRVLRNVLQRRVTRAEAAEALEIADVNGDGCIDFTEFADAMDGTRLLNPDRLIYGEKGEEVPGGGIYPSLLVKDTFEYKVRGIKSRVADWVDELGSQVAQVFQNSTLPDPPLLTTMLRWRQFQRIRRRRVNDSIRFIEKEMGAGLEVWRELQSFPDPLLEAMKQKKPAGAATSSPAMARLAAWSGATPEASVPQGPSRLKRAATAILFGARRRIKRPIAMRLPPMPAAPNFVARAPPRPLPKRKGASGFGTTRDGTAMDTSYRRLVATCANSSPSTIRSFQRATDRWRDGRISTSAYVRATESLFGALAPRILTPLADHIPERIKAEALLRILAKNIAKAGAPGTPMIVEAASLQASLEPSHQLHGAPAATNALHTPPVVATDAAPAALAEASGGTPARRQFWRLWRRSRVKERKRELQDEGAAPSQKVEQPAHDVGPRPKPARGTRRPPAGVAPAVASSRREPPVYTSPSASREDLRRQSARQAERAAVAVSRSAVVGFLLNRPLTGGELETLQIKIKVYLMGGLTARNLYDSVSVLVGDLASMETRIQDLGDARSNGVFFARKEKERAVEAILTAAMAQLPKEKERPLRVVLDGVTCVKTGARLSDAPAPETAQGVAREVAEAMAGR